MNKFTMWTLFVLCSVIATHGVQGADPFQTTEEMNLTTSDSPSVKCGGYLYGSSGTFYSPNYPNNYPNSSACTWYISAGSPVVQLDLSDVNIEAQSTCDFDALYVYDGSSNSSRLLGKVCGKKNNVTFHSTGAFLTVQFKSDNSVSFSGFRADYRVVGSCRYNCGNQVGSCSCSSSCEYRGNCCHDYKDYCISTSAPVTAAKCGGHLYGSSGTFYSPNYPNNYPNSSACTWYISAGSPIVQLDLSNVNIEAQSTCDFDALYVYDGSSNSSRLLGKVCGKKNNVTFHSTGAFMTVHFKSDSSVSFSGFRANYRVVGSCRYNCGNQVGSCSCSSSCEYRGNCCHDYKDYCISTSAPVTARPSCRYNCGYHLGSCSCSSSCQYYGNCCYDYYSYCGLTTDHPEVTTARPSCRYNCGYHLGSCSCSSSCQYYGNCCHDYYSYCSYSTNVPTTVAPCGGTLFGSGNFTSPNYPNYYHDNAYCVWQLRVPLNHRIYLAFTYLQLENCCSCDYINVYDGPSLGSQQLGKICNNSLNSFYSSSNYMTVLFRTDGSVVARGFTAKFISALPPNSGRVTCSSDSMNIVIEKSYLNSLGYDGHSLYLDDPNCRPQISTSQVVFSFPINTCGTVRKLDNGRIVYTNTVRAYTSIYGQITRQSHFKMNVGCRMEEDSVSQIMYLVEHNENSTLTGTGRFNTSMAFYTSSNFYNKVTQFPYVVTLNQNLYVQVDLRRGDSSLVVFIDTCVASPSPYDFQNRSYYLVQNGCRRDDTYGAYITGSHPYARFTFKAFQFLRATESVYIQCKVLVCPASDYNSRCRRGCYRRMARDLGSKHDSQTLVLGPIQLKDPEEKEEDTNKKDKA